MGRIEVIAGCMYSGKTEELIRRLIRARIAKQGVVVFKPAIDTRYGVESVVTHAGMSFPCRPIQSAQEILSGLEDEQVVGIDEAQFFDAALPDIVEQLASVGRRVVIAGLDLDSDGRPFGPMPQLMAMAEEVTKPTAVCTTCGGSATRSQRMVRNWERVLLGSTGAYDARCRKHWKPGPEE